MSTVNVQRIIEESFKESDLTETYSFKMSPAMKDDLIQICQERSLSPGKVLRALTAQFLSGVEKL